MPLDIPQEQLDRIQPIVDELSSSVHRLFAALPFDTESALVFRPDGGSES